MKVVRKPGSHSVPYRSMIAVAVASIIASSRIASAQTADSTLRGHAPANTTVTAVNTETGSVRHTTAAADGSYALVGLPAGTYKVDAGPGTEQQVTLQVASSQEADLGTALEEIKIVGNRIQKEVRTSEVGSNVSLHNIDVLPQVTRNFLEFAETVPGMKFNVDSKGNTSLRGGGQLTTNVNVYIDGVSQKEYIQKSGGTSGQAGPGASGDPGNPFPQLAIDQYKVITSNYKAEYGEAASAIVIAQTKTGTNEFKGEAFSTFTNQNFRALTPAESFAGSRKASAPSWEYGLAEGGPIIQDHLHFFLTWEHKALSEQNTVFPGGGVPLSTLQPLLPPSAFSQYGPTTNPFKEDLIFGNMDFEPTAADKFELSTKIRKETSINGAQGQTAPSAATNYRNNNTRWNLSWQRSADRWVNSLRVSSQSTLSATESSDATPQSQYIYYPNSPTNRNGSQTAIVVGGPGSGTGSRFSQSGLEVEDALTLPNLQWMGSHTVKTGLRFQNIKLSAKDQSDKLEDASYFFLVGPTGTSTTPYEVQFPVVLSGLASTKVDSTDKQYGFYLQDDWRVNDHLELNLGVRWDYERVPIWENYVTPKAIVAAINGPFNPATPLTPALSYAQVLALGGPNYPGVAINNYISTGSNRSSPKDQWQPRLGFSYDINADQKNVVFGGYGRSYDRNLLDTLSLETTKVALNGNPQIYFPNPLNIDDFGPCKTAADINPAKHCYVWNDAYLTAAGLASISVAPNSHEVDLINNNIKNPYSDQFSLGFRHQMGDWSTAITIADVRSYNTIMGHWGNRYANGHFYDSTGNQWGGAGVPGFGALILWDNGGKDEDRSVGVLLEKPYTKESGWSTTIAYTYSDATQNNFSGQNDGYAVNYNQYFFDAPYPSDFKMLPSNAIPKHRLVATYSHDAPWGVSVAGKLTLETPIAVGGAYGCPAVCTPYGGTTVEVSGNIPQTIGYRDLDLQATKDFKLWSTGSAYVRLDLLNVFDYYNFDNNSATWSKNPGSIPQYNTGGAFNGVPRTLKLSLGMKW